MGDFSTIYKGTWNGELVGIKLLNISPKQVEEKDLNKVAVLRREILTLRYSSE